MNSNQKNYAYIVWPAWTELKCASAPYSEINYYLSLSGVRYAAMTTVVSVDISL